MSIRSIRTMSRLPPEPGTRCDPVSRLITSSKTVSDERRDWMTELLAPIGVRRRIAAQSSLFNAGDRATHYFLVESGQIVVHRHPRGAKPSVRLAEEGDLLIYDCDGVHAADCHSTQAAIVFAIDRRRLELRAILDPALRGILHRVHAGELTMILESLGIVEDGRRHDISEWTSATGSHRPRSSSRGRWQPYLAHVASPT